MKTDTSEAESLFPQQVFLIAGTGRSGTTWLGKILDSSPHLFYKAQPDDRNRFAWFRNIPSRLDPAPEFDCFCALFLKALHEVFWAYSPFLHERPDFPKTFLLNRPWSLLATSMRACRKVLRDRTPTLPIPREMFRIDPAQVPLVIKSVVSNLRLAWVHRHFPSIKIILIIRHPGGYLNSIFKGARDYAWVSVGKKQRLASTVLPFPRPEQQRYADAFENGSDFERELIYWIVANETPYLALRDTGAMKTVIYEELCLRPMETVREIFDFLDVPLTHRTVQFINDSTREERTGFYSVYKNPMHSAFKWRDELNTQQHECIDKYLSDGVNLDDLWRSTSSAQCTNTLK